MIAKTGFILLVVVFGALMFVAGVLTPSNVRIPLEAATEQIATHLSFAKIAYPPNVKSGASPNKLASASSSATTSEGALIPVENLLIPTPIPEKGQYALQAGQFANIEDANALCARIKSLKLPSQKVLEVQDQNGHHWSIVAVGSYANLELARSANNAVAAQLGLIAPLPLILLPVAASAKS